MRLEVKQSYVGEEKRRGEEKERRETEGKNLPWRRVCEGGRCREVP
jgi:hypothetical protein